MGFDKRTILMEGETLIERMCNVIKRCTNEFPTVVGDNLSGLTPKKCRVISDYQFNKGPIGGLISALKDGVSEWALVTAVDMPNLKSGNLQLLYDSVCNYSDDLEVITLSSDGRPEPLAAMYRKSTVDFWKRQLSEDRLSLRDGIRLLKWRMIKVDADVLRNINRSEDLIDI